jgi:deoxyinosine 3'endonuclease (endonuclease V)
VQHLIGPDNADRLDPPAPPELARLDRCEVRDLIAKAAHHSRVFAPRFETVFAAHAAAPYKPFHFGEETVGYWLRTRAGTRPLAVHAAWRTDPETAVLVALASLGRWRMPEPLRAARHRARTARGG